MPLEVSFHKLLIKLKQKWPLVKHIHLKVLLVLTLVTHKPLVTSHSNSTDKLFQPLWLDNTVKLILFHIMKMLKEEQNSTITQLVQVAISVPTVLHQVMPLLIKILPNSFKKEMELQNYQMHQKSV